MKKILLGLLLAIMMTMMCIGCGKKAATEADLKKAYEDYEDGKISQYEYYEIQDAVYNGEPLPDSGGGFLAIVGEIIVICIVVGGGVILIKRRKR